MPAKDTFHDVVIAALIKEGWVITHDPYTMSFGGTKVYADLGAERAIAAQRGAERIAVEIKSFVGNSDVRELEVALGQFILYRSLIRTLEPDRVLLLAVPESVFKSLFEMPALAGLIQEVDLKIIVFDIERQEIVKWMK